MASRYTSEVEITELESEEQYFELELKQVPITLGQDEELMTLIQVKNITGVIKN